MPEETIPTTAQGDTEAAKGTEASVAEPSKEQPPAETKAGDTPPVKTGDKTTPPEKYELKLPEKTQLDPSAIERISTYAKEKGLSNEEAQALLDREQQAVDAHHDAQMKKVEEIRTGWAKDSEKDAEIGGQEFKQNVELAKRVVERFGSDAFKQALNETGFGNHPEVLRTFVRIGKLMSEDQIVNPKAQGGGGKKAIEDVFYSSTNN